MQAYDLIMLIVLGMSAIFGAIKGLAWQVASLASIIVSYIVACRYRVQVAGMIDTQPPWNMFLAMLILYVGTGFVIWVGFRLMSNVIDKIRLKTFDRHLGALFGLGKGVVFCLLITMFAMTLLGPRQQAAICQSRSGYYISAFLDKAVLILPQEVHSTIGEYLARLDNQLKQGQQNPVPLDDNGNNGGMFNTPNLSNLSNGLQQLIPDQLNNLLPQTNPSAWPNGVNQPTTNNQANGQSGFPGLGGLGSPSFGSGQANGFGANSGMTPSTSGSNFGTGFPPGNGTSSTGLRPSGSNNNSGVGSGNWGAAELPGSVFPR